VVKHLDRRSFVLADIPGLISGAHEGLGMGIQFLRHIERTSLLLHIIDISEESNSNAWSNYSAINKELRHYNPALLEKPQIVALNKIDLPFVKEQVKKEVALFKKRGIILYPFSAVTGEGITKILNKISGMLNQNENK
jgi:GTP-binding protein